MSGIKRQKIKRQNILWIISKFDADLCTVWGKSRFIVVCIENNTIINK